MEATTIEDAVGLITQPTEAPQEAEAVEAAEVEDAEVIEETEAETPTQEFESEYSDDDIDDLDDIELEDVSFQEAEQPQLITVKSDGTEKQVTLDQLKQSYAGQDYIQRRMQEVAQMEKQFQAQTQQLAQREQQLMQLEQQVQQFGMTPPEPPSKELFDEDPIGYMQQKMEYDEAVVQFNQRASQMQQLRAQQQAQTQAQQNAFKQEQAKILAERLPDIVHPEKGDKLKSDLFNVGVSYGFSEQEMANVTDARYILALNDALKWRRLQQKKTKAVKGTESTTPVVKAGAKRRASEGEAAAKKKQQQRLQKSGRIEDAINLMLKP